MTDDLFRRCLRRLRLICGRHNILPESHIISDGLKRTSDNPVACGGFADVWEGTLRDEKVCVKVLRMYRTNTNNPNGSLAVCDIRVALVCSINVDYRARLFMGRQLFGRGSDIQMLCLSWVLQRRRYSSSQNGCPMGL